MLQNITVVRVALSINKNRKNFGRKHTERLRPKGKWILTNPVFFTTIIIAHMTDGLGRLLQWSVGV